MATRRRDGWRTARRSARIEGRDGYEAGPIASVPSGRPLHGPNWDGRVQRLLGRRSLVLRPTQQPAFETPRFPSRLHALAARFLPAAAVPDLRGYDFDRYHLRRPPFGYHWVQVGGEFLHGLDQHRSDLRRGDRRLVHRRNRMSQPRAFQPASTTSMACTPAGLSFEANCQGKARAPPARCPAAGAARHGVRRGRRPGLRGLGSPRWWSSPSPPTGDRADRRRRPRPPPAPPASAPAAKLRSAAEPGQGRGGNLIVAQHVARHADERLAATSSPFDSACRSRLRCGPGGRRSAAVAPPAPRRRRSPRRWRNWA